MKTLSLVCISCCFNIVTVVQCTTTTTTTTTRTVAFQSSYPPQSTRTTIQHTRNNIIQLYTTGGWGIGPQREMLPEEFARRSDNKRIFDGYQLSDRGEFMRQVQRDKDLMIQDEISELLGVANAAGITVKNPAERLNKFSIDDIVPYGDDNDTATLDIDDDIDLRIQWADDDDTSSTSRNINTATVAEEDEVDSTSSPSTYNSRRRKRKSTSQIDQNSITDEDVNSITRFDEDTGASGVW